jgi:hypothetical protein
LTLNEAKKKLWAKYGPKVGKLLSCEMLMLMLLMPLHLPSLSFIATPITLS